MTAEARLERQRDLESARYNYDGLVDEVRALVLPITSRMTARDWPGTKIRATQVDAVGEHANEMLASGVHALLADPHSMFFHLRPADRDLDTDHEVGVWLDRATTVLHDIFAAPRSNFAGAIWEALLELTAFGTGTVMVTDRPGRLPLFEALPLAETFLDLGADGQTDTLYRKFCWTARQAWQEWGEDAGPSVMKAIEGKRPLERLEFLHAIERRTERDSRSRRADNMPIASEIIAIHDKHTIRESGFREFPAPTGRWSRRPGEIYGRGCGMKALPDVKLAQRAKTSWIQANELAGLPPWLVADDGLLGDLLFQPMAINRIRSDLLGNQPPVQPLMSGVRPDITEAFVQHLRTIIEESFYVPLMRALRERRNTATEAMLVVQEARQLLWPFVGRIMSELLDRLIARTLAIAIRRRFVPPAPEVMGSAAAARVEYLSPIALTRRAAEVTGYQQWMILTDGQRAAGMPVDDVVDMDLANRESAIALGMPQRWLKAPEAVADERQARAEAAAEQAQAAEMLQTADVAAKVGKALPNIREGLMDVPQAANAA